MKEKAAVLLATSEGKVNATKATEFLFGRFGRFFVADIAQLRYIPSASLARAARSARLGPPLTNEHRAMFQEDELAFQFFMGGLVWAVLDRVEEIHVARW